ncbi:hypothetical protein PRUPE_6G142500 [Prunus persica]|uniref:Uncharacterized protein n=1 Tax=Prunus persica TaxID=3760 RepID=A0A251NQ90_PRUPE|nr:hypothetical protein PRUPE_6G142500 [Prunus persica]
MAHHHLLHSMHLSWLLQLLRQFNESWLLFEGPQSWSPWSLPSKLKADTQQQDLNAITGFQAFSMNLGSEVEDLASIAWTSV